MQFLKFTLFSLLLVITGQITLASNGELLLFHNGSDHPVTQDFLTKYAPQIEEMAKSQGIDVKQINVSEEGTTKLVRFTPAIVFQNHLGRSLYVGRYHYVDKIKTFIRTVKRLPQKDVINRKHDVMVWENDYAKVLTPVKVTSLAGSLPKGFDQEEFKEKALAAIAEGTNNYRLEKLHDAFRTDRLMYAAFYPHLSKKGKLSISVEAYSQFNCVIPVYKQFDEPVQGSFRSFEKVFQKAGALIEEQIIAQLGSVERGDGFLPIGSGTPMKTFDELGYPLPPAPEGATSNLAAVDLIIPQKWTMDGPIADDVPLINFNFPAPLDYYAGEIKEMEGGLELGAGADIKKSLASFSAILKSMTMGDESLDEHVGEMIELMEFPKSNFTFKEVKVIDQPVLNFGSVTQIVVNGTMDFKGLKAPVTVTSQIELVLNEAGDPRLQVYAFFKMPLKEKWDVDGPDGPEEASNFLDFNLNFLLKPKQSNNPKDLERIRLLNEGQRAPKAPAPNEKEHGPNVGSGFGAMESGAMGTLSKPGELVGQNVLIPESPYSGPDDDIKTKTIEVNGLTYTYLEKGKGKAVFLLHGFPDLATTWEETMHALSGEYRCIAPFLRGYYPTDTATDGDYSSWTIASDIAAIAKALGIEKYSVIGHDWGASVAYNLANLHPDQVDKLVTVAIPHPSYIKLTPRLAIRARHFLKFRNSKSLESTRKKDFAYIDKLVRRWAPNWEEREQTMELVKETFRKPGRLEAALGYYWTFANAPKDPERDELSDRIPSMPFLVFAGKSDGALVMKPFRKMEKELGDKVKIVIDEEAGHFFHQEAPELFHKEVKAFLKR